MYTISRYDIDGEKYLHEKDTVDAIIDLLEEVFGNCDAKEVRQIFVEFLENEHMSIPEDVKNLMDEERDNENRK